MSKKLTGFPPCTPLYGLPVTYNVNVVINHPKTAGFLSLTERKGLEIDTHKTHKMSVKNSQKLTEIIHSHKTHETHTLKRGVL
jgi:hypothetical protein